MGLPTARVQAELRCSAPGGRMAPQHYRASPTRAPPMGRPRPTSSWLSELTPRPPLCVCLCLFVGEKEGGEHPPRCGISLRSSHDTFAVWWCEDDADAPWLAEATECVGQSDGRPAKQRNRSQAGRTTTAGSGPGRQLAGRCEGGGDIRARYS